MELPYDPVIPFFWHISQEIQNTNLKKYMYPYVHCSVLYISRDMEAIHMPITDEHDTEQTQRGGAMNNILLPKGPPFLSGGHPTY